MRSFKYWLFVSHRWLGISLGALFALWFVSGVAMMFVRMPILTPEERFARLPAVPIEAVRLAPAPAWKRAGLKGAPKRMRLASVLGRPAYLMLPKEGKWVTVFADNGEKLNGVSPERAGAAAAQFAPGNSAPSYLGTVREIDQWTLTNSLNLHRPLHRFAIDDAARTEIYVSQITGEVVMRSTRIERALAWVGPILHWGAPEFLRKHVGPWRASLLWLSALGTLLALGGVMRWRGRKYQLRGEKPSHSPYRGLKKWHHVSGLFFGFVTLTWIWSGWLYLNPGSTRAKPTSTVTTFTPYNVGGVRADNASKPGQSEAIKGGALSPALFALPPTSAWRQSGSGAPREIELTRFAGRSYYVFYENWNRSTLTLASRESPVQTPILPRFGLDEITTRAQLAVPGARMVEATMLSEYDAFYYSVGNVAAKRLPIARVKFDDADKTWFYINPHDGSIFRRYDSHGRLMRWLVNGLHCLDFPFLMFNGPLWHITVIVLSLGGLVLTLSGLRMGVSRLRPARRASKSVPQETDLLVEVNA